VGLRILLRDLVWAAATADEKLVGIPAARKVPAVELLQLAEDFRIGDRCRPTPVNYLLRLLEYPFACLDYSFG
jgi:hypothetical protein